MLEEYKLMGDGYAKGINGDKRIMRSRYRTAHALAAVAEENGLDPASVCSYYQDTGCKPLTNYLEFCRAVPKTYRSGPNMVAIPPIEAVIDKVSLVNEESDEPDYA